MHSARPTEVDSSADPIASTPTSVPAWWIGAYAWERMPTSRSVFTEHFGLVSDFLAETWTRLRDQSRLAALQGRVYYGGALSGRDTNAVNKTVSGLLKLLYPDTAMEISDADIEWAVRLALESRRRVKEQQKRVGAMEFRNTHFSYTMGEAGVEQFVTTPELQSPDEIGADPLPPGQVWAISPGGEGENPGLYRIDVTRWSRLRCPDPQPAGAGPVPREHEDR
jgi:ATP-dependent Lon protease